jgi:hypothetical protein
MGNRSSRGSAASERTTLSDVTDSEGSSTRLPSLHGNLMRSQHKRDPMKCVRYRTGLYRKVIRFLHSWRMLYDILLTRLLLILLSFCTHGMELIDCMRSLSFLEREVWDLLQKLENVVRRSGALLGPNSLRMRNAAFNSFPYSDSRNRTNPSLKTFPNTTAVQ